MLGWKPRGRLPRAGRDDGRRRPRSARQQGWLSHDRARSSPASAARTAATSPSGCSPTASRCTPSPHAADDRRPTHPACDLHRGDLTDVDERARAASSTSRPTRSTTSPRSARSPGRGSEPDLTARVNGDRRGRAAGVGAARLQERARPAGAVRAGLERGDLRRAADQRRRTRPPPIRPVNPYGAAKAYAHLMVDVYRRRGLHAVSAILYNHESPRRPAQFVTRKITADRRRDRPRRRPTGSTLGNLDARRDWGWAPDYVDAMVRAARADAPRDYVVATGESALGARLRRRRVRAASASTTGSRSSTSTRRSSGRPTPTDLTGDADPGPRACSAGRRRSTSRSSSAGWSTPTSAAAG